MIDLTVKSIQLGVGCGPQVYSSHSIRVGTHIGLTSKGGLLDPPLVQIGCRLLGATLSHPVTGGVTICRDALHRNARIRGAACRCHGARCQTVMGSHTQALVKRLHAGFVDSLLCEYRGRDRRKELQPRSEV